MSTFLHKTKSVVLLSLFCFMSLLGCSNVQLAKYDAKVYEDLTYTKPIISAFYDTFGNSAIDQGKVDELNLKLSQIKEYVAGRANNIEMTNQIDSIQKMFARHLKSRQTEGAWNQATIDDRKQNIMDAFNLAIATEQRKNQ